MNYNGENFVGTNENIIEIVSSYSELELLKRSGNENIKVCLPLSLCIGKLDSIIPYNRDNLSPFLYMTPATAYILRILPRRLGESADPLELVHQDSL